MSVTKDQIRNALRPLMLPDASGSLESAIEWIAACEAIVSVKLHFKDAQSREALETIARACDGVIREPLGVVSLSIQVVDALGEVTFQARFGQGAGERSPGAPKPSQQPVKQQTQTGHNPIGGLAPAISNPLPNVKRVIAIGAGKGGVGKSTIAVTIAIGLARRGRAVGLMDGDIYGPSLPTMLGLDTMEQAVVNGMLSPHLVHGVKAITIGKLVDPEKPLIWRGPMAHGAFKQLVEQTAWGDLDDLIVDLPPGTGDVPLTMAQMLTLSGAVIVCTPQRVAQDDAVRATRMFTQLGIDIIGVVENMSYFIGDDGVEYDLFGRGGAERMAQRLGLPFLGAVPITIALRKNLDEGRPADCFDPATAGGDALPAALNAIIDNLEKQLTLLEMSKGDRRPTLNIS